MRDAAARRSPLAPGEQQRSGAFLHDRQRTWRVVASAAVVQFDEGETGINLSASQSDAGLREADANCFVVVNGVI